MGSPAHVAVNGRVNAAIFRIQDAWLLVPRSRVERTAAVTHGDAAKVFPASAGRATCCANLFFKQHEWPQFIDCDISRARECARYELELAAMDLSIIIVSYNTCNLTIECLRSIYADTH